MVTPAEGLREADVCRVVDGCYAWLLTNRQQHLAYRHAEGRTGVVMSWPLVERFVVSKTIPKEPVVRVVLDVLRTAYYARCVVLDRAFARRNSELLNAVTRARSELALIQSLILKDVEAARRAGPRERVEEEKLVAMGGAPLVALEALDARLRVLRPERDVPRTLKEWTGFVQETRARLGEVGMTAAEVGRVLEGPPRLTRAGTEPATSKAAGRKRLSTKEFWEAQKAKSKMARKKKADREKVRRARVKAAR